MDHAVSVLPDVDRSELVERVLAVIDANWQREVECLRALVAAPTLNNREGLGQAVILRELEDLDVEVDAFDMGPEGIETHHRYQPIPPDFLPADYSFANRPNVVARWASASGGGRSLILNGHVDVVSTAPDHLWTRDPWGGQIEGNRMYGRGTADMKGGLVALLYALRALQDAGVKLAGDLIFQSVVEEEGSGHGTLSACLRGHGADAAIITEPSGMVAVDSQVGLAWARVTVRTGGGHAQEGTSDTNAILKAAQLVLAVREFEIEANNAPRPERYVGMEHPLKIGVNVIRAGDWPSTVPAEAVFEIRYAYFPGQGPVEMFERLRDHLLESTRDDAVLGKNPPIIEMIGSASEGYDMDPEAPIFGSVARAHQLVTSEELELVALRGGSDACIFNYHFDTPAVHYGPTGGAFHAADEWIDLDSVAAVTKIVALAAIDWCGVTEE